MEKVSVTFPDGTLSEKYPVESVVAPRFDPRIPIDTPPSEAPVESVTRPVTSREVCALAALGRMTKPPATKLRRHILIRIFASMIVSFVD
jgi:hypothetical protein